MNKEAATVGDCRETRDVRHDREREKSEKRRAAVGRLTVSNIHKYYSYEF
jgi:hypothetical protein